MNVHIIFRTFVRLYLNSSQDVRRTSIVPTATQYRILIYIRTCCAQDMKVLRIGRDGGMATQKQRINAKKITTKLVYYSILLSQINHLRNILTEETVVFA
jgi:hypothetical protein